MNLSMRLRRLQQTDGGTGRCTSSGALCGARSCGREEARLVGRGQSGDCEGGEEAVGEGEEAGEEGYRVV